MNRDRRTLAGCVGAVCAGLLVLIVPQHEGTVLKAYRDPIGIVTSCMGHTGPELRMGQVFTRQQCEEQLALDLIAHAEGVKSCVKVPMTDRRLAAMVSFAYNVGTGAFCKSTLVRKLNERDYVGACAELSKWVRAGGKVLPGLVRRRAAERALCESKA